MGGERYNIFRFNSGKQGKTMPDYNPYTIKRCNDCDVTRGKLKLISDVLDNEFCSACQCIHNCQNESNYYLDEKYRERLKISIQADNTEVEENTRAAHALLSSFPDMTMMIRKHDFKDGVKNPEYLITEKIADRKGINQPTEWHLGLKRLSSKVAK